jgi:hypothetical protein
VGCRVVGLWGCRVVVVGCRVVGLGFGRICGVVEICGVVGL